MRRFVYSKFSSTFRKSPFLESLEIDIVFVCTDPRARCPCQKSELPPAPYRTYHCYNVYETAVSGTTISYRDSYCARTGPTTRENRESGSPFFITRTACATERYEIEAIELVRFRRTNWLNNRSSVLSRFPDNTTCRCTARILVVLLLRNSSVSHDATKVNIYFC